MQFYKKRDFGELISDTFSFLKIYGKNFFKNYLLINGLLLCFMVFIIVFMYKSIFAQLIDSNTNGQSYYFENYFQENSVMLIIGFCVFLILSIASMLIAYTYPVFYMKRLSEAPNNTITSDQILFDLKQNIGKIFIFFLGLLFIIMPIGILLFSISTFLMLILIGYVIILFLFPSFINLINFTLFDYFHTDKGFFSSLSYGIRSQFSYPNGRDKSPFWKYWGATIVNYLMINVITTIFTMVPMIIFMIYVFTVEGDNFKNPDNIVTLFNGTLGIIFFVIYGVSILVSIIMMNIIYITSGLSYYDSRTDLHRNVDLTEIETIGKSEL